MKSLIFCLFFSPIYNQFPADNWDNEMVHVNIPSKAGVLMSTSAIYNEKWNELNQPNFWKQIMVLHPDSMLVNVAASRQILAKIDSKKWNLKSETEKSIFKDSLRHNFNLPQDERLFFTSGKNHFYKFDKVYGSLSRGIIAFERYEVDPWYAQAILLIESPGQLLKSNTGAYGAFQLMPGVARQMGLQVSKNIDERKDFDRSAYGAASLIRRICIPETKRILTSFNISYQETDLWFRLLVMHVYHAGASNVRAVVNAINPSEGGQALITKIWQTSAGGFQNASQNYTQLVLASQMIIHEMVGAHCTNLFACNEGAN
jgi:hypothetical protein